MSKKKFRLMTAVLFTLILASGICVTAFAAEQEAEPIDGEIQTSRITMHIKK